MNNFRILTCTQVLTTSHPHPEASLSSHVVIISPNEASTIVFPVSRDDTLHKINGIEPTLADVRTSEQVQEKAGRPGPYSHMRS